MKKFAIFNPEFDNNHIQDALKNGGGGRRNFPQQKVTVEYTF
jgi:hypothetical protein